MNIVSAYILAFKFEAAYYEGPRMIPVSMRTIKPKGCFSSPATPLTLLPERLHLHSPSSAIQE
jgi:hypothetical protein